MGHGRQFSHVLSAPPRVDGTMTKNIVEGSVNVSGERF